MSTLRQPTSPSHPHRLVGLVVKASDSRVEDPGFESRLRRDFFFPLFSSFFFLHLLLFVANACDFRLCVSINNNNNNNERISRALFHVKHAQLR